MIIKILHDVFYHDKNCIQSIIKKLKITTYDLHTIKYLKYKIFRKNT